jgi:hypothetical protein
MDARSHTPTAVLTFHVINAHLNTEQRNRDLDLLELIDARGATTNVTPDQVRQLVDWAVSVLRVADLSDRHRDDQCRPVRGWRECILCSVDAPGSWRAFFAT